MTVNAKPSSNPHLRAVLCLLSFVTMVIGGGAIVVAMVLCRLPIDTVLSGDDEGKEDRLSECHAGLYDAETGNVSFNTIMKISATVFVVVLISCVIVIAMWYRLFIHREEVRREKSEHNLEKTFYPPPEYTSEQKLLSV